MADPLMDMADGLVAALNAEFAAEFTAVWKDDALANLSDEALRSTTVWVVDEAESLSTDEGHVPLEEFGLLVIVQRKLVPTDDKPALCRTLSDLVARIARFCRRTQIAGAVCPNIARKPARDLGDYNKNDRFYAEILTTWRRVHDDE